MHVHIHTNVYICTQCMLTRLRPRPDPLHRGARVERPTTATTTTTTITTNSNNNSKHSTSSNNSSNNSTNETNNNHHHNNSNNMRRGARVERPEALELRRVVGASLKNYMRNLLGQLETRLAQHISIYIYIYIYINLPKPNLKVY